MHYVKVKCSILDVGCTGTFRIKWASAVESNVSNDELEFNLTSPEPLNQVRPKEPLYSMLMECPADALKYTLNKLTNYTSDAQLDDRYPEVGLTRREYIEQVHLAMNTRQLTP